MTTQMPGSEGTFAEQTPTGPSAASIVRRANRRFTLQQLSLKYGLIGVFLAMAVVFWVLLPAFGTIANLWVILESMSIVAVAALGVTFSLAVGGWDLSIGSNVGFVVMVGAIGLVELNWSAALTLAVSLGAGLLVGAINALLIVKCRIPDMIATLGTMFVFEGLALVIANGNNVAPGMVMANGRPAPGHMGAVFSWIGGGTVGPGIPGLVLILVAAAVVVFVLLERSRLGRSLYAIGLNTEAARLAGMPVRRMRALAYLLSGLLGGVAGVMLLGLLGQGQVDAGSPYLLECVAAALIAFAFLGLKRPSAHGTVFGSLFVSVVINGLTMFNVPYYAEDMTYGLLLILTLILTFTLGGGTAVVGVRRRGRGMLRLGRRDGQLGDVAAEASTSVDGGDERRSTEAGPGVPVPLPGPDARSRGKHD